MVAYTDIPEVNTLYTEIANIDNGITIIDAGGKLSNFTITPAPPDPNAPMGTPMTGMSVMILTIDPSSELMAQARASMVARHNAILTELAALGVTAPPPTRSATRSARSK